MSTEPRPNNRRLALFPLPFQGHINPMLQLANILHTKGFKITIIHTHFNSPNQSNYPQFTFKSISDGLSESKNMNLNLDTPDSIINFLNKSCINPLRDCLVKLQEEEPIACLISDALWHFSQSVADSLNLPRIVLRTSSMSCILVYSALLPHIKNCYLKTTTEEDPIPDLSPITEKDMLKIFTDDCKEGELELIFSMIKTIKAASGIIWNTFKELEEPAFCAITQNLCIPSFPLGPFHKYFPASSSSLLEQDRSVMLWLDLQPVRSVVYVSFGSIAQMGKAEFSDMARGACKEVLAHPAIGGFWTHNGWNSTLESICEGVPMICSPCSYDQPINARYVTDVWRVGVMLENGKEEEFGRVMKSVIMEEEGSEMRQRSKYLQEKVNLSMEKGGSAYESLENLVDFIVSL
ncbi:unnamed protein product [Lactuca saligna]|uniref:Glycosyltransferase n=1 Tax=Lactuca saligna TaxID=75948 RepID=A0AA35YGS1_LACSI|nr:unnamed protein product [Lactuca saligna]